VNLCFLPRAIFVTFVTLTSLPFVIFERIRYSKKIKQTIIDKPPIFIVGHWRGGTSYLHMLLTQDKSFAYVSNLQAVAPAVFISGGNFFRPLIRHAIPQKRRMDNFALELDNPSEDEFALANLTPYSIYNGLSFPQNMKHYARYCFFEALPQKIVAKWKNTYIFFLKKVTFFSKGKRLVLKNPVNTCRIKLILELFPEAKFIHIHRNPYEVFASTLRMYRMMFPFFYLQKAAMNQEEFIINLYLGIYNKYFEERAMIPSGHLIEVSYDDLLQNPLNTVRHIYEGLSLKGYKESEKAFISFISTQKNFKTNTHVLSDETREKIASRWKIVIKKLGYTH